MSTQPIRTAAELAKLVERDKGTVGRWLKRQDWPFGKPPWPQSKLPEILRWVADTLLPRESADEEDDAPSATPGATGATSATGDVEAKDLRKQKLRQEIRKLHAQADTAETALARERGKLIEADEVEREWAALGAVVRNGCQNLASQLVPLALSHGMPHEAAPQFQSQAEEAMAGILRHLSKDPRDRDAAEDDDGSPPPVPPGAVPA